MVQVVVHSNIEGIVFLGIRIKSAPQPTTGFPSINDLYTLERQLTVWQLITRTYFANFWLLARTYNIIFGGLQPFRFWHPSGQVLGKIIHIFQWKITFLMKNEPLNSWKWGVAHWIYGCSGPRGCWPKLPDLANLWALNEP